jgi:hypothetical protein
LALDRLQRGFRRCDLAGYTPSRARLRVTA